MSLPKPEFQKKIEKIKNENLKNVNHMASLDLFETYFVNSINYPKKKV
jgi:hypothetical protein